MGREPSERRARPRLARLLALARWLSVALLSCGEGEEVGEVALTERQEANRAAVVRLLEEGIAEGNLSTIEELLADRFVQHGLSKGDGREGFLQYARQQAPLPVAIYRTLADRAFVAAQVVYGEGSSRRVGFEVFRVVGGKLTEQWSATGLPASQGGQAIAGWVEDSPEVQFRDRTEENRAIVAEYVLRVFGEGRQDLVPEYLGATFAEHSGPTAGLGSGLRVTNTPHVLAEGNFVLVASEGHRGSGEEQYGISYDLFWTSESKIIGHLGVAPPLPADPSSLPHANGLFCPPSQPGECRL